MRKIVLVIAVIIIVLMAVNYIFMAVSSPVKMVVVGSSNISPTNLLKILKEKNIDTDRVLIDGSVSWTIETDVEYESAIREALSSVPQVTLK